MYQKKRIINFETDSKPSFMHAHKGEWVKNNSNVKKIKGVKKILDVGCWTSQLSMVLDKKFDYYGIDVDESLIQSVPKDFSNKIKLGSATKIPFKNSTFDVVCFFDVIEHLPENSEIKALKEIFRVLKKGGVLFLSTPNDNILSKLLDPGFILNGHRHYKKEYLIKITKKCGFKFIESFTVGGFFRGLEHLYHLLVKHLFRGHSVKLISDYLQKKSIKELKNGGFLIVYVSGLKK